MTSALLITVRLHEPRYHGRPEWPPSPARMFQALIAGAGHRISDPAVAEALCWLERLPPPIVAAPRQIEGKAVKYFVPNNDLDTKGGDPANIPDLRTQKVVQPRHLAHEEIVYAWTFEGEEVDRTGPILGLAAGLYQLGRGVDMASAQAKELSATAADERLRAFDGTLHHPGASAGTLLLCPRPGTLESLVARQGDFFARFGVEGEGRVRTMVFRQPRKALLREVGYGAGVHRWTFDLRRRADIGVYAPVSLTDAHACVVAWRDLAEARLIDAGLDETQVRGVLIGRRRGESAVIPTEHRARILPLPSIGHEHADPAIRRLLVEVPDSGPLPSGDIRWAFSGLAAGEATLVPAAAGDTMVRHYTRPSRRWASVTPVALPSAHLRPHPAADGVESGLAREATEADARAAVFDALRHAGIVARPLRIEVQREPWSRGGERAERFAVGPRFGAARLWHVRICFDRTIAGPMAIGDGRFLGLGVMAPDRDTPAFFAFRVTEGLAAGADGREIAHHLRRAVLARAQRAWGRERLPQWLSGHQADGSPSRDVDHTRFLVDPGRGLLFIQVPRRSRQLDQALEGFTDLRAGHAGRLMLEPFLPDPDCDACLRAATAWNTLTPYLVERHVQATSAHNAVATDLREACRREGLPAPEVVTVRNVRGVQGLGVTADVDLTFAVAVSGPLSLGRDRYLGGGFFRAVHMPQVRA